MKFLFIIIFYITLSKVKPHIHIKIDLLCDDFCTDLLINDNSIKDEINLITDKQIYFHTINFTANPGDRITFVTYNSKSRGGISARIIIKNQDSEYKYNTTGNQDMFSFNISDTAYLNALSDAIYNSQNDNMKDLLQELQYSFGPINRFEYTYISYYFDIPNSINHETEFTLYDYEETTITDITFTIDELMDQYLPSSNTYNLLYFMMDDNNKLKGKFFFSYLDTEIQYNTLLPNEREITYYMKPNTYYYEDIIYFTVSHGEFLDFDNIKHIYIKVCPEYCDNCNLERECEYFKSFEDLEVEILNGYYVQLYYDQILATEFNRILVTSTNNFFQNDKYIQPDLNNCQIILQKYFNINNLILSITYNTDFQITKILIYKPDYSLITVLTDFSICEKNNIYYNEELSQILECHELCKTCYNGNINNCNSCYDGKILTSKDTCVDIYEECGEDRILWLFEAYSEGNIECLDSSNCPLIATKIISETLECVNSCDNININLNCISCKNKELQIYNSCVDLTDSSKSLEVIQDNIVKLLETNPLINSDNITYYISSYPSTIPKTQTNLSDINLGDCEDLLREKYTLSKNENFIILQIETKIEGKPTSNLQYYIYSSDGTLLDLSVCSESEISITKVILDTSSLDLDNAIKLAKEGVDIYNINDDFFNNFCNGISVNNQDLTLENRIEDVYVNVSLCDDGCEYQGINLENYQVICSCFYNNNSNITNEKKTNKIIQSINNILNNINYKIIKCYMYWNKWKYLKNNFGFFFSVIVFSTLQIILIICCIKWYKITLNKVIYDINQLYSKTIIHENINNKEENIDKKNSGRKTRNSIISKSRKSSIISFNHKIFSPQLINNTINNLDSNLMKKSKNEEDKELENKQIKKEEINGLTKNTFYNYFFFSTPKNKKKRLKDKNSYRIKTSELTLITSNNTSPNLKNSKFKTEESNKNKLNENNKDIDFDELNYYESLKEDKRQFTTVVWHSFLCKIDITAIFIKKGKYEYYPLKISVYLFSLLSDFTINALLFSDDVISSKYKNGGELKFWESWILSVLSNIFGKILTFGASNFTDYNENLEIFVKEIKIKSKCYKYCSLILNKARRNIRIYFILQNILLLLYVYYLTIFCALYKQSQKALFKNYILGALNSMLYSLIFAFVITIFRFLSLYYHQIHFFLISKSLE